MRNASIQRGFALIYVLVIVGVLAGLLLGEARERRIELRVAQALVEQQMARDRLQAAGTLLVGRLQAQVALQRVGPDLTELVTEQAADLFIDGEAFVVSWEDADLRPDANVLIESEWQRLLTVYGFSPEQSERFLQRLAAEKRLGGGRIDHLDNLLDDPLWPAAVSEGSRGGPYGVIPPLAELLATDGNRKRLHARDSSPVLFAILLAALPDQLASLANLRRMEVIQCKDLELAFGPALRQLCYDGHPQRLRLKLTPMIAPLVLEMTVSRQGGRINATTPRINFVVR